MIVQAEFYVQFFYKRFYFLKWKDSSFNFKFSGKEKNKCFLNDKKLCARYDGERVEVMVDGYWEFYC